MTNLLLAMVFIALFAYGYWLMGRLEQFLFPRKRR